MSRRKRGERGVSDLQHAWIDGDHVGRGQWGDVPGGTS